MRLQAVALILLLLCGGCAKSSARWESELQSGDAFVRGMAAIGLGLSDPEGARAAVPILLETIDRSDVGLEPQAAEVLFIVGRYHVDVLLLNLVLNELMSSDRRGAIKNALVAAGPVACEGIAQCLAGPGKELAGDLGDVLLAIGPAALPAITSLLDESIDTRIRNFAAYLLGRMGPGARSALPALRRASKASDEDLRESALNAIARIQGSPPEAGKPR
ncbi:MAG: hypothetical protein ACI8X5_000725 [Planctomycetota bacterium]|jgi:hypothetical protein